MRANGDEEVIESLSEATPLANAFEYLFENASDAIYILDMHGNFVAVNRKAEELTGFKRENYIGKSFREVVSAKSLPKAIRGFLSVIGGKSVRLELELKTAAKETVLVEVTSTPFISNGKIVGTLGIARDITERKKMEEALESESYLETILNSIFSGVVVIDEETHEIVDANPRALETIGASREHVIGKVCHNFICPAEKGRCPISDLGQTVDKSERVLLRADGEKIPILKTVTTAMWRGRKYLIESFIDVTEHKKAEKALEKSEEMFKTLMEEAPISICNTTLRGKITYVNKRFEEALGYSREEIVGKNGFKLGIMSDETLKLFTKRMKERLMGKPSRILEGQFKRKDGEWIWAETESRVIKKFGVPVGFQLISRDITERKRAEEERKRYEEKLSALNIYSQKLGTAESMEEIYRLTLDAMRTVLGFEYADLMMIDKGMLCIVDQRGYPEPFPLELPLDGSKGGITIKAIKTGNSVLVQDVRKNIDFVEGLSGVLSELAVPIKIGQKILGVLNVENKKLNTFDEKDQELLEILASHAATAIENLEYAKNLEMHAQEIRESQEKFERLFMDNPEAAVYVDSNFRILDINPRFTELFGYSLDEIKSKHIDDVVVPKDKTEEAEMLNKKSLEGPFYHDTVRKRKAGSLVPVSVSVAPIIVEGKNIGSVGLYRDITERKRFEEKLSALNTYSRSLNTAGSMEEIYRLTLDAMEKTLGFETAAFMVVEEDMLYVVDQRGFPGSFSVKLPLDGTKRGVSVKAARTGRSLLVPDAQKEEAWVEFLAGGRSGLDVPIKSGHEVLGVLVVESTRLNAFDEKDQELLEILASHAGTAMSNLEYAKNLEMRARELQESQEKFERLFMDSPEAYVYLDPDFRILDFNPRFTELFGYSSDEVKGKHVNDVIVPEEKMGEGEMLDREALKGYVSYDTVRKRKDGSLVPVSISAAPIAVGGKLIGCVGLYKDITERKQMEKKLEEYSQHLEELVEKRTIELKETQEQLLKAERLVAIGEVAAMVGHDLRNPLTGIAGAAYYLKTKLGSEMDRKTKEMLELIENGIEHSNNIVTDLLEYSREIRLDLTETNPKIIMKEALCLVKVPKSVKVADSIQSEPKIKVDLEKMKRVFVNIIKNAVDAMPHGGTLTITSRESNGDLDIVFADTGLGMARETLDKLWTPFFTTKARGMGLGLPICKRIVEAHGGKISVESRVRVGTTFTVTLSVKPKLEGGEEVCLKTPESLLSMTTKA